MLLDCCLGNERCRDVDILLPIWVTEQSVKAFQQLPQQVRAMPRK